ncbi:hypothetical protein GWI33_013711 [Rhynchophorus ferrugineus]|uniref:Uncharacterized protein n=1 Tax=Rhynchophorus ferrugineus TaxID=354439 RepID=A0A834I5Z7_RHYFE|nr:hypothetical protein GWI33_013711 [Rhynchophorus ferrugineus]
MASPAGDLRLDAVLNTNRLGDDKVEINRFVCRSNGRNRKWVRDAPPGPSIDGGVVPGDVAASAQISAKATIYGGEALADLEREFQPAVEQQQQTIRPY